MSVPVRALNKGSWPRDALLFLPTEVLGRQAAVFTPHPLAQAASEEVAAAQQAGLSGDEVSTIRIFQVCR